MLAADVRRCRATDNPNKEPQPIACLVMSDGVGDECEKCHGEGSVALKEMHISVAYMQTALCAVNHLSDDSQTLTFADSFVFHNSYSWNHTVCSLFKLASSSW